VILISTWTWIIKNWQTQNFDTFLPFVPKETNCEYLLTYIISKACLLFHEWYTFLNILLQTAVYFLHIVLKEIVAIVDTNWNWFVHWTRLTLSIRLVKYIHFSVCPVHLKVHKTWHIFSLKHIFEWTVMKLHELLIVDGITILTLIQRWGHLL